MEFRTLDEIIGIDRSNKKSVLITISHKPLYYTKNFNKFIVTPRTIKFI